MRDHFRELQHPWHMGLAAKYNIAGEALSHIFQIQQWRKRDISLLQALWIARLYAIPPLKNKEKLFQVSMGYAVHEALCMLTNEPNEPIDTAELDSYLLKDDFIVILADKLFPEGRQKGVIHVISGKEGEK